MDTARTAAPDAAAHAAEAIARCRMLATFTQEPGWTTRTFLSAPMRQVHAAVGDWMARAGMDVRLDAVGNIRGRYAGERPDASTLYIGSHLDTVPHAGAFDGILGVVAGIAVVQMLAGARLPYAIEAVGLSDEEGTRFGIPFIGSRGLVGTLDDPTLEACDIAAISVREAISQFGLDAAALATAQVPPGSIGWLELHIEQGPVLDERELALGIVRSIAGQTRLAMTFTGAANHAGTTPMARRRDALAAAAEWIAVVEREAVTTDGLVATVGAIDAQPGAANVIAGRCRATLDLRHETDAVRLSAKDRLVQAATVIAHRRQLDLAIESRSEQPAVPLDPRLTGQLEDAVRRAGLPVHRLASGAGHDAMIVAPHMPAAMLFVRSPRGISHHPDETVVASDVAAALGVLYDVLITLAANHSPTVHA